MKRERVYEALAGAYLVAGLGLGALALNSHDAANNAQTKAEARDYEGGRNMQVLGSAVLLGNTVAWGGLAVCLRRANTQG